jgi:hypothetical protein
LTRLVFGVAKTLVSIIAASFCCSVQESCCRLRARWQAGSAWIKPDSEVVGDLDTARLLVECLNSCDPLCKCLSVTSCNTETPISSRSNIWSCCQNNGSVLPAANYVEEVSNSQEVSPASVYLQHSSSDVSHLRLAEIERQPMVNAFAPEKSL